MKENRTTQNNQNLNRKALRVKGSKKRYSAPEKDPGSELSSLYFFTSHDLQEPLRKIQTFSTLILEEEKQNLSDRGKDCFQRVQKSAQRMQMMIDDLAQFSKIQNSSEKYEVTDLNMLIKETVDEFDKCNLPPNATINLDCRCELSVIVSEFKLMMRQMISNSLKFSGGNPLIGITARMAKGSQLDYRRLEATKRYCHIRVHDNGIGFEPRFCKKIFELFQRLHTRDEYEGTGIGLAICKKVVENHQGFICASSQLNQGAIFDIYIPETRS